MDELLQKLITLHEQHTASLVTLMERSEARIDRTNEIVCKLAEVAEKNEGLVLQLTSEYSKHLDDLSACRNALLDQNKLLLQMIERDRAEKESLREEIKENRDRIFALLTSMSGRGVKIENS